MEDDQPIGAGGHRRGRGLEAEKRTEALKRLKALWQGGRRSSSDAGYEIKLDEPIYKLMEDDEYKELVNKRRKEVADFIEIDNADGDLGYCDDGGKEEFDGEGFSLRRKKVEKKVKENSSKPNKSSAELSVAAAIIGKQRLSSMFTSSSFNKKSKETDKVKCESIVDDVIKQFALDESDRERRRRGQIGHLVASRGSVVVPIVVRSDHSENRLVTNEDSGGFAEENLVLEEEKEKSDGIVTEFGDSVKESVIEEKVEVDVEMKVEPVEKKEEEVVQKLNAKISKEEKDTAT